MRSLLLVTLAISLVGLLFFFIASSKPADALDLSADTNEVQEEASITGESAMATEGVDHVARSEVAVEEKGETGSETAEPTGPPWLTGRCLSAETSEALAGVNIRFNGWAESGITRAEEGMDWESKQDETDADGRFVIHLEPHPKRQYRLSITSENLANIERSFAAGTLTEPIDLGDLYLQPGAGLDGRVIFENGEPIASLSFEFQLLELSNPESTPEGFEHRLRRYMNTDSEGKFKAQNMPMGSWDIMMGSGLELRSPEQVNTLGIGTQDIILVVSGDGASGIKGLVRTEDGEPIAGVYVHAFAGFTSSNARSKEDGSFELYGHGKAGEEVQLYQSSYDEKYEPVEQNVRAKWGDKKLELLFRRVVGTDLDLSVVDATTGKPIEEYALRCFPTPYLNNKEGNKKLRMAGVHQGGRTRVNELRDGSNTLVVLPKDSSYAPGRIVTFDLEPGVSKQLRVELEPAHELLVKVQDLAGNPVPGARVELLRSQADNPMAQKGENYLRPMLSVSETAASMSFEKMYMNYYSIEMVWRMAESRTDEAGMATIYSTVPPVAHALRASLDGRPSSLLHQVSFEPGAGVHVITMKQGSGLELAIRPAELLERFTEKGDGVGIRLIQVSGKSEGELPTQPGNWETWDLPESGNLSKTGLMPGNWRVMLQGMHQIDVGTYQSLETELAEIELVEGETLELTIDPSKFIPSRIRGSLRVAGRIPDSPWLTVKRGQRAGLEAPKEYYPNQVKVDSDGEFETPPLSPGPYSFQLKLSADGVSISFPWTQAIELAADRDIIHGFDLPAAALELRLTDGAGHALAAEAPVILTGEGNAARIQGKLDAEGRLILGTVPLGTYRGKVTIKGKSISFEAAQIVAGSKNLCERKVLVQ